jgi:hypothetical protein
MTNKNQQNFEENLQPVIKRQNTYVTTVPTILLSDEPFDTLIRTELTIYGTYGSTYTLTSGSSVYTTTVAYPTSTGWGPYVPLTTIFTPPASCFTQLHAEFWDIESATSSFPYFHLPNGDSIDCFPPGFMDINDPWYSPGICPSGYKIVSSDVATSTGSGGSLATVTRADCCPT